MNWYWWVLIGMTVIVCWRFIFRLTWEINEKKSDEFEKVGYSLFFATAGFWAAPAFWVVGFFQWLARGDAERFARMVGGRTKGMKEREREAAQTPDQKARKLGTSISGPLVSRGEDDGLTEREREWDRQHR